MITPLPPSKREELEGGGKEKMMAVLEERLISFRREQDV